MLHLFVIIVLCSVYSHVIILNFTFEETRLCGYHEKGV